MDPFTRFKLSNQRARNCGRSQASEFHANSKTSVFKVGIYFRSFLRGKKYFSLRSFPFWSHAKRYKSNRKKGQKHRKFSTFSIVICLPSALARALAQSKSGLSFFWRTDNFMPTDSKKKEKRKNQYWVKKLMSNNSCTTHPD